MFLKTAESVTCGHPDKVCDQISDSILDEVLRKDPTAHVACEVMATKGCVIIAGEITAKMSDKEINETAVNCFVDTLGNIGYDSNEYTVTLLIHSQSPDINQAVNKEEQGAGDQGIMYGYACNETNELLPLPVVLANRLTNRLREVRENKTIPYILPDGKSQVTVEYDDKNRATRIANIVISTQHADGVSQELIDHNITQKVILPVLLPFNRLLKDTDILINPSGRFVQGGPAADTGLTGRKLMVDTYGGLARHGGGAFSGKDPSKVDRSGAYFARYVAKSIVMAGFASECEVSVSYAIGQAQPTMVAVNTFNTGSMPDGELEVKIKRVFDFRPKAIIDKLMLTKEPIYGEIAQGCHFMNEGANWERLCDGAETRKQIKNIKEGMMKNE